MSKLFLRTLRDDPADAELISHKLLVRAGYVRRIAPGIFSWLPLGYQVYRNIENVVRQEMNRAGFQEVHFPALLPREPFDVTNRWNEYGDTLFRLQDRKKNDYLLGPTHEEMFTLMVKGEFSSYKDLPLSIYQIQTKYRDEARPRAGILRGREFVMKDSYSFDLDEAGLEHSYLQHRDAYRATFDRLFLDYVIVSAMSGAMGGSKSEEFLAYCPDGEDTFVQCAGCGFAANVEAVETQVPERLDVSPTPALAIADTPNTPTIETLVDLFNTREDLKRNDREWSAADTLKNVVFKVTAPDGKQSILAIGVPGDREVDIKRLEAAIHPLEADVLSDEDFLKLPQLVKGYIGPTILGEKNDSGIRYLVDPRVVEGTRWISGANESGKHAFNIMMGRDFLPDGTIEAADVRDGDSCPKCETGVLRAQRGIEIGHIFQLGRKYAQALELSVLDEQGQRVTPTMGSYGIGVSRLVAVVAEQSHDDKGLIWPREISPAHVHIVAVGKDEAIFSAAENLAEGLEAIGVTTLIDDRLGVSVGVKFNDAELIGIPWIIVVGKKLQTGDIEVKNRRTSEVFTLGVDELEKIRDLTLNA